MDTPRLDDQLCFALYAATRAMTRVYRPLLDALELTYPQYLVMLVLWEGDDLSVSALGERLMLDSGTLTPLLKRLEQRGLIARRRDDEDERRVQIILTEPGRALSARAPEVLNALLCRTQRPAQELAQLRQQLRALTAELLAASLADSSCGE